MLFSYLGKPLKEILSPKYLKEDLFAGFNIAIVAIPLALAIGLASSVPPGMALTAAIIGGVVAAIFGGTRLGVSGPALSMTILIASCVATHGLPSIFVIGFVCGVLQFLSGVFKLGRFTRLIPIPIIYAFTSAIAVILLISAIPSALQIESPNLSHLMDVIKDIDVYITQMNPFAFVLALITIVIARKLPKYYPKMPAYLVAVLVPTLLAHLFTNHQIAFVGSIPHGLHLPQIPNFMIIHNWHSLIISALSVFILASLESVLSANALDKLNPLEESHKPNHELIGQGLANCAVAIFGGIPITQLLARSKISIDNGAKTRRAAIFHSIFIFIVVYFFPQIIEFIPISVLAGVLISAAISMINVKHALEYWRNDKRGFLVYSVTFIMLVFTNLVEGIQTGVMVALLIMVIKMLRTKTSIRLWDNKQVMRISISGNLTILSIDEIDKFKYIILKQVGLKYVIFEFQKIQSIDNAGGQYLIDMIEEIQEHSLQVIVHGLTKDQYQLLKMINVKGVKFYNTITESEIKYILEQSGVEHSANEILKHGMATFHEQYASQRTKLMETLAKEQKPHTLLITCSDSRLNPNEFFAVGLGEIFVIRNVGNVVPPFDPLNKYSEVAAIEYAVAALDIRNIVICAHTECGAIKASMSSHGHGPEFYGLDNWLQIIKDGFAKNWPSDTNEGTKINALYQVENLKTYPMVHELVLQNKITISAWVYDVHSAHMLEWRELEKQFVHIIQAQ